MDGGRAGGRGARMMRRRLRFPALLLAASSVLAGCSGGSQARASEAPGGRSVRGGGGATPGEITVFAAASLTESFRDLAAAFDSVGGGARVLLNLAGSQELAAQILAGAPADVYASANAAQMDRVADAELLSGPPEVFAENRLAIVTEPGNPKGIHGLADLARPGLEVVLAAPDVPVGRYAREALAEAGVDVHPVSLETDVKQVLAKVVLGEADAGIVYRTDVLEAGRDAVTGIPLPAGIDVRAGYRVAVLGGAPHPAAARAFVSFLRSPRGGQILREHGFDPVADADASSAHRDVRVPEEVDPVRGERSQP